MIEPQFSISVQVHIQNSTLAGGVAIGSAANLSLSPGGALGIGIFAGILSTIGYIHIQPALEATANLRDTCGVHNLHGMPGILGGLVGGQTSGNLHLHLLHSVYFYTHNYLFFLYTSCVNRVFMA